MDTATSVTKRFITCTVCQNEFDNPKSLPCLHTFCLKCLERHFIDKCPGDEVPCVVCQNEFMIPLDGLCSLHRNVFIQQLLDSRNRPTSALSTQEVPCQACLEVNEQNEDSSPAATMYCVDCSEYLCERCSRPHTRTTMKGGAHQVRPLGAGLEQELLIVRGSYCDKHKDKQVELYCHDCNENICRMCLDAEHVQHKSEKISEVAKTFLRQIDSDSQQILSQMCKVREKSRENDRKNLEFLRKVYSVKGEIKEAGNEVSRIVDKQVAMQLDEVDMIKSEDEKKVETVEERYQLAMVAMLSFCRYSRELMDKGRPSDVTRTSVELHKRATELLNNDVTSVEYHPPHVTFTPADVTQVKCLNLTGKVTLATEKQTDIELQRLPPLHLVETELEQAVRQQLNQASDSAARLQDELNRAAYRETSLQRQLDQLHQQLIEETRQRSNLEKEFEMKKRDMGHVLDTLPEGEPVCGMTSLDNLLYVLRAGKKAGQIEVYDMDSYRLQGSLTVPGHGDAIIACAHDSCVYISDITNKCVRRVGLPRSEDVTHWPVNDKPFSLSVTDAHSVLVLCDEVHKIKEFSSDGKLLRETKLPQDVTSPWHTVQLSDGQFIVCHGDSRQVSRVCRIGSGGCVVKSYGGPVAPASHQINVPVHLAVDENGFIFVVDLITFRVLLLSPDLAYVRDVVSRDQLKWHPLRLSVDVQRRRLYVAVNDWKDDKYTAGRVVIVSV